MDGGTTLNKYYFKAQTQESWGFFFLTVIKINNSIIQARGFPFLYVPYFLLLSFLVFCPFPLFSECVSFFSITNVK